MTLRLYLDEDSSEWMARLLIDQLDYRRRGVPPRDLPRPGGPTYL
jgi:hypothetical protein